MPKVKTHSSSKKRFKVTGNGKIKMSHAYRRHRLISKPTKSKKQHKQGAYVPETVAATIRSLIPYK